MLGTQLSRVQTDAQHCWMLHVASICTPCCMHVVGSCCAKFETGQTVKRNNVGSICTALSNIDGAAHAYHKWFTKSYELYPSHDALLGVSASIYTPVPKRMQQLPILLAQQCWELLHPFASNFRERRV